MCGIGLLLHSQNSITHNNENSSLLSVNINQSTVADDDDGTSSLVEKCIMKGIAPRGPDSFSHRQYPIHYDENISFHNENNDNDDNEETIHSYMRVDLSNNSNDQTIRNDWILKIYASVLHLRGSTMTAQPYFLKGMLQDYLFCWNGECYSYQQQNLDDEYNENDNLNSFDVISDKDNKSDTAFVMQILKRSIEKSVNIYCDDDDVPETKQQTYSRQLKRKKNKEHLAITRELGRIHGEYSFILYCAPRCHYNHGDDGSSDYDCHLVVDKDRKKEEANVVEQQTDEDKGCIYFGRDPFGRRSLLMTKASSKPPSSSCSSNVCAKDDEDETNEQHQNINSYLPWADSFVLSSVALTSYRWEQHEDSSLPEILFSEMEKQELNKKMIDLEEIVAGRVYCLDLNTGHISYTCIHQLYYRSVDNILLEQKIAKSITTKFGAVGNNGTMSIHEAADFLHTSLDRAVRRRVVNLPKRQTLFGTNVNSNGVSEEASVAVLFSGGVDSVVLAALCQNHVPEDQPIDLINVSFASSTHTTTGNRFSSSPDRQAALLSFYEMKAKWPHRNWRFIAVNVDYSEVLKYENLICGLVAPSHSTMDFNIGTAFWFASRGHGLEEDGDKMKNYRFKDSEHLRFAENNIVGGQRCKGVKKSAEAHNLKADCTMRNCKRIPQKGCIFGACKFCCSCYQKPINKFLQCSARLCPVHNDVRRKKSKGVKVTQSKKIAVSTDIVRRTITSKARVVLVGIGADEQMAGYARHRTTYNRGGYDALRAELEMEKARLWTRNLGRDDRCISYHGKEARFPFLDENVVEYLNSLDVLQLCDMTKPQGEGDKMILRLVAKKIGVQQCSGLVKRAIQFGSRIAKVSDVDRFGSSRKASGTARHKERIANIKM